ncbi:acyl carrier protein [Nocardiopsis sp. LOL_012]|uniref:acyl carrier protein n=1 Tax=Nocardiopsis sp. LOL_012 TaxID=3345409 RepID=UPI003A877B67
MNETEAALRQQVGKLIEVATGRVVTVSHLEQAGGSLEDAGVNSIGYINLMEALERKFGVVVDQEADPEHLTSVDSIVAFIRRQAGESSVPA